MLRKLRVDVPRRLSALRKLPRDCASSDRELAPVRIRTMPTTEAIPINNSKRWKSPSSTMSKAVRDRNAYWSRRMPRCETGVLPNKIGFTSNNAGTWQMKAITTTNGKHSPINFSPRDVRDIVSRSEFTFLRSSCGLSSQKRAPPSFTTICLGNLPHIRPSTNLRCTRSRPRIALPKAGELGRIPLGRRMLGMIATSNNSVISPMSQNHCTTSPLPRSMISRSHRRIAPFSLSVWRSILRT